MCLQTITVFSPCPAAQARNSASMADQHAGSASESTSPWPKSALSTFFQ